MALFSLFITIIFIGVPIAFAFAIAAIAYVLLGDGVSLNFDGLVTVGFGALDSFVLMAIPFFIFAGDLMKRGGIIRHLINFSGLFLKTSRSGIGGITVLTSTFFGAISGSSAASVAAVGSVMVPEMELQGYRRPYAAALVAASGFIGILIPPSIPLILYGLASSASIGDLFLAGIGPGLLVMLFFVLFNAFIFRRQGGTGVPNAIANSSPSETAGQILLKALPGLFLPILILGGIYSGVFTPTEAAAVAVAYAIVVGRFVYKSFAFKQIPGIALESAVTSATIMIIIGFAAFFGRLMTLEQIPAMISEFMLSITDNPILLTLLINVFLLFLGMFIETATVIVLVTPILMPLITELGIDPVHFGVIMIMNLSVGLITPPMALNLFVAARTTGVELKDLMRPIVPFFLISLVLLMIITFVPAISTFIPNALNY